jgi:ribosomal protein S12 methylthiotransferase
MQTKGKKPGKIHIVTLGCSKNVVDSQFLARQIEANNIQVEYDREKSAARTLIINTCGFIKDAKQESLDTILQAIRAREAGELDRVFVMGCLSERYKKDLQSEIPEVDQYFGVNDIDTIIKSLGLDYRKDLTGERTLSKPDHYAYLKVSEGCDRSCAFCAIPLIRGGHQSKSVAELVHEAEHLSSQGARELILIAQDLSSYGKDLDGKKQLGKLLEQLSGIAGIGWIRLHYAYPAGFPNDVIPMIRDNPKICRYLDIPFQHISDKMLKLMRRGSTKKSTLQLIEKLRRDIPGIALRTSLLTGHPGEDKEDFKELLKFVNEVRFERLGVFTYSHEEDTYGWKHYSDNVPEKTKQERASILMEVQREISRDINEGFVGKTLQVLVDREEGEYLVGRSEFDSPEVDNEVLIKSGRGSIKIKPGMFAEVQISRAEDFDLFAEI